MIGGFRSYLALKQARRDATVAPELRTRGARRLVRRADAGLVVFAAGALVLCAALGVGTTAASVYVVAGAVTLAGLVLTAVAIVLLAGREPR